ncbi:sugar ABC transporter permease [Bacillaceae bacterium SIJ1]|uniref:carbohydrate ABC transporter permease n=1 Tax=Litoribacterium kuwaitense TaxID=1398745 RepID=UPI0013EC0DE3|nr:sugar ABC transporter permease [Litoribacterium kuwaitense]NGP45260.1 sugar ABC transporter permease [Litoribacterium kuwaitense]
MHKKSAWEIARPYVMITPAMVGIILFVIYPVFYLMNLSMHDYNLLNPDQSKFIGLENFKQVLTRGDFYNALSNTAIYTAAVVFITMGLALIVAIWLNQKSRFNRVVQAGMFTPHIISTVSISLVWMLMMEPNHGLLNFGLTTLGLPSSAWLQSSSTSLMSVIIVAVWGNIGYFALIIIAALQGISPSIYEAAALDNGKRMSVFTKITLPMISPQLFFILVIMTIGSFKVFETVNIMTGGGPNDSTSTLVYYIYEFRTNNIGYASATGVLLMIIISVLTIIYFRLLAKKVHYQ